ncbi:MAG: hypothetical protein QME71_03885 [Dehalococcoidia bacterium]|nr:hypothetical protein [Dehalococcoidia bacterium]
MSAAVESATATSLTDTAAFAGGDFSGGFVPDLSPGGRELRQQVVQIVKTGDLGEALTAEVAYLQNANRDRELEGELKASVGVLRVRSARGRLSPRGKLW